MAALNNTIYIGSVSAPDFKFENADVDATSIDYEESVDLIESELAIDVLNFIVKYTGSDVAGLVGVAYGTPVFHYVGSTLMHKFYIKQVQRIARDRFKISTISPVGLLSKQYHKGGVYTGTTFRTLARQVVSKRILTDVPDDGSFTYRGVTVTCQNGNLILDGQTTGQFYFSFDGANVFKTGTTAANWLSNCKYNLPVNAGHRHRCTLELTSGSIERDGRTYVVGDTTPTNLLVELILFTKDATAYADVLVKSPRPWGTSEIVTPTESATSGAAVYVYHTSGVPTKFNNAVFNAYIEDLDDIPYSMDDDIASTKLFGWLPYDTKRKNLHQVMFAENISIVKNADGDMHFTFIQPSNSPPTIPQNRIFVGGTIKYPAVATSVSLTEHSYQNVDTIEPVVLIDNSDKTPANNKLFVFEQAPIVVSSITAAGDLTIVETGVNYAIVSGQGVLTGRPYYDKQSTVEKNYNSGGESYTVSVEDATLVTGVNSENVADRLLSYYTSSEIVSADLKIESEKCGRIYQFVDMFGNTVSALLTKMRSKISSLIRSSCEFVSGYVPSTFGNNYTHWGYVTGNTGTITIQAGTKIARFVIIGGGNGGSSGLKGVDNLEDLQAGGIGGEGGIGGNGGKIREVVIHNPQAGVYQCSVGNGGTGGGRCSDTQTRNQGTGGSDSTVTCPDGTTVYSTADSAAYYSKNGIKNLFTEDVYAIKGRDGCKGGNGGRGTVAGNGEAGEDVLWDGVLYHGGAGGKGLKFDFEHVKQSVTNGGAGGWGAQPYMDGANGGSVTVDEYHDLTSTYSSTYKAYEYGKFGQAVPFEDGNPHTVDPSSVVQIQDYGEGGDGGHGGAGRGGFGSANDFYQSATDTSSPSASNKKVYLDMSVNPWNYTLFNSSDGGAGNNGRKGIILCYADKEVFF